MSELRVALIAEGPTDTVVIEAALKALLSKPFILTQLQPEPTRLYQETGWGGVLRWCLDFGRRGHTSFESDPTLPGFDLFVLHVDADVAGKRYADISTDVASLAVQRGWPPLPDLRPCPPASDSADAMRTCLVSWTGLQVPGPNTVLCVPAKAVDAWLAAAVLDADHPLLNGIECNLNLEAQLKSLPKTQRIKKSRLEYLLLQSSVTKAWPVVRLRCSEAERFSADIKAVVL
jgi:hypothetical protein